MTEHKLSCALFLPNNRSLERFSIECRNLAKTNITLANQKGHRQSSESMKTRSKYIKLAQSAGKRVRESHDRVEKVARNF